MKCPSCGHENPEGATHCASCKRPLAALGEPSKVEVKLCLTAIASTGCAMVAWACCVPGIIAAWDRYVLSPELPVVALTGTVTLLALPASLLLGVVSLIEIGASGGRRTGYGFAAIGTAAPAILVLVLIYVPVAGWGKSLAPRLRCGTNLSGIGKAMLIYANDYEDRFLTAGGEGSVWGPGLADWKASHRAEAFGLDPNGAGGQATISSSLYLLVKYGQLSPDVFVCRGDRRIKAFQSHKYGISNAKLKDLWDFGPNPARHCSYSYHVPYGEHKLTMSSEPGLVVAADRNPWIEAPHFQATQFSLFQPDVAPFNGTPEDAEQGNTPVHGRDGQNVLFLDSHVEFTKRPYCALQGDNVYTSWDGDDKIRGIAPQPYESQPANQRDSLLVNDPPRRR